MKKLTTIFIISAVLCMGVVGALALMPHAHGEDLDHSQHSSCAVHQFAQSGIQTDAAQGNFFIALFFVCYLLFLQKSSPVVFSRLTQSLRGPPSKR